MMIAFLEKSVSPKTVQKYFLVGCKSGVGFQAQKTINKFLTYITVWWDVEQLHKIVFCVPGLHRLNAGTPNLHNSQKRIRLSSGSDGKEPACNAGDPGSIPESGRSLGEGNGNPLQYSCLENPMGRGTWPATVRGVSKNQT